MGRRAFWLAMRAATPAGAIAFLVLEGGPVSASIDRKEIHTRAHTLLRRPDLKGEFLAFA
jgi:hypothetical protein